MNIIIKVPRLQTEILYARLNRIDDIGWEMIVEDGKGKVYRGAGAIRRLFDHFGLHEFVHSMAAYLTMHRWSVDRSQEEQRALLLITDCEEAIRFQRRSLAHHR